MATTNPSVTRATKALTQLYTIDLIGISSTPNYISGIYSYDDQTLVGVKGAPPYDTENLQPVDPVTSENNLITDVQGNPSTGPWTATITNMSSTVGLRSGDIIYAKGAETDTGSFNTIYPSVSVAQVLGTNSITIIARKVGSGPMASQIPTEGTITGIVNQTAVRSATIPSALINGGKILITNVQGMPELATGGENNTNAYYVAPPGSPNEQYFNLFKDAELTIPVNSSTWTPAVANTGQYNIFTVPNYGSVENTVAVTYENFSSVGTEIDLNFATGQFELAANYTYSFDAIAYVTGITYSNNVVPTYQWYNVTTSEYVGNPAPIGSAVTYGVTTTETTVFELRISAPNNNVWIYPATLRDIVATVQVVSGFVA